VEWLALFAAGAAGFGLGVGLVAGALVVAWLRRQAHEADKEGGG
jgi:hypothetical protein